MRMFKNWVAAVLGTAVLTGGSLLAVPGAASADPQEAVGHETRPGQPYRNNPEPDRDWLGSYLVNGQQVWCVQFALTAPDSGEEYQPGDELKTKWGTAIPADVAADISYLLLRYGNTQSPDEAAALAHLLHSWTAAPRSQADLDPGNDFTRIAYDADDHLAKLPESTRAKVESFKAEAGENRGPWEAELTSPEGEQTIGQAAEWTLTVQRTDGKGIGGVPVQLSPTDVEIEGVGDDGTVTTPEDGGPLTLQVTPTGPNPKITGKLSAPAERPYVRQAVNQPDTTQRVVSTGGEQELSVEAETTAVTAPGVVKVGKTDSESQAGIAGVSLRVTAADGSPAVRQDGTPLVGEDGEPAVVVTGDDGTAEIADLRTPQEIKIVEVKPAPGYEEAFDEANPPSVTGTVEGGQTLELSLVNKPNTPTVPVRIPAGDPTPESGVPAGLLGLAGLTAVTVIGGTGFALRRRIGARKQ